MKLLSKKEIKKIEVSQRETAIKELSEIRSLVDKRRKELNDTKSNYGTLEDSYKTYYEETVKKMTQEIEELEKIVGSLSEQKKELLKPVDEVKKNLNERETVIQKREIELEQQIIESRKKEDEFNIMMDSLTDKFDWLRQREDQIVLRDDSLDHREQYLVENESRMNTKYDEFAQYVSVQEQKILDERQKIHKLQSSYEVLFEEIKKERVALDNERIRIESKQQTLSNAFNEARLKGVI